MRSRSPVALAPGQVADVGVAQVPARPSSASADSRCSLPAAALHLSGRCWTSGSQMVCGEFRVHWPAPHRFSSLSLFLTQRTWQGEGVHLAECLALSEHSGSAVGGVIIH